MLHIIFRRLIHANHESWYIIEHSTCFDHSPYKTAEKYIIGS